ncbi:proprotein convertase subtilisin/kexin type 5 [Gadus morhua]|nr:proprotein convertase subtilisin/kexin type 5-like [Gadus morhua]
MAGLYAALVVALFPLCNGKIFTNDWAVKVAHRDAADRIAEKHGFTNMGQIGHLENYFSFRHNDTASRSTVANRILSERIAKETQVRWLQQQVVLNRAKRNSRASHIYSIDVKTKHTPATGPHTSRPPALYFNDPQWNNLWYIHCSGDSGGCPCDMRIEEAWSRGYTGKGVVVSVLDDGVDREHPDLKSNYDPLASEDVNGKYRDPSLKEIANADNHGTKCAGIVAAAANNSQCTVGVSFQAWIGGVRMLDGDVTDLVEAQSLGLRPEHVDIYLAVWGPEDDGATLEGPGPLASLALKSGALTGRQGKGSVFVWASGNGGRRGDHCSCDGYANSIYTISISSVGQGGGRPDYLEECSSTLATAYGGGDRDGSMITLAGSHGCIKDHSGTSASSSMAAGVIALALEANPMLTWRDVQHIIVKTAQSAHLPAPDWHVNGAGYKVSHLYGFGLLDAESMVKEAEGWRVAPQHHVCEEEAPVQLNGPMGPGSVLRSVVSTLGCSASPLTHVAYVEHVVVRVTVSGGRRGDLSISLTSPSGTVSRLLSYRPLDGSMEGFSRWEFMTTHCWGEESAGEWLLELQQAPAAQRPDAGKLAGTVREWTLVLHGTSEPPYSTRREKARSADMATGGGGGGGGADDLTDEYSGPCDPECSDDGCEGPGPQQCVMCLHFFLKFKNNTRSCVSACPAGSWGDRRRCKRCFPTCGSCSGSRSDQCVTCQPGHHLSHETPGLCVTSCEAGGYLYHDANTCKKCSENCLKCTSSSICTECKPGTSLQGNRCQTSCGLGFYLDTEDNTCEPCDRACATCAGGGVEACDQCAAGYLMEEWRCVSSCSPGFYLVGAGGPEETASSQGTCRRCDPSCGTCSGPVGDLCTSCSGGHSLHEGACVLSTVCGDGLYQQEQGPCQPCDQTCVKCAGPGSHQCISCASSRFLDEGACVEACPPGRYGSGGRCHLCDHTCATCVDDGGASCSSCDMDKFRLDRYLFERQCVQTCPEGFHHSRNQTCEACPAHCQLCSGPGRCLACNASFYLSEGVCVKQECGEGEVEDPDYDDCMACEEGCKKCVLYNPRHCLSCTQGFYNFQDGCYKYCPAKTYSVEADMTCVPCDPSCVSCDAHQCYWCETDLFLSEGVCVAACLDGAYADDDTHVCEECHPGCLTCAGPEEEDCLSCAAGKRLAGGRCAADQVLCPGRTFQGDDGVCKECHPVCETCSGRERNQCTTCGKGRYLTQQRTCVSRCPPASFEDVARGVCQACAPGCVQCEDAQRCLHCQPPLQAAATWLLQDGTCVHQCDRGYAVGQVCHSCAEGCASCGQNSTHCLSCQPPLLLLQTRCVSTCPPDHLAQGGSCLRCPPACQRCTPPGQCTECEEYHFLHEGHCVLDCPERFYDDADQRVCGGCHPTCLLCDGPGSNDCDTCSDPDASLHNGACRPRCPAHFYRDALTGECKECDPSCLTCLGPRPDSCVSCQSHQRPDDRGRCLPPAPHCPPHRYLDQDGECILCHPYCHQCSGPGTTHCSACHPRHMLLNGSCVDSCPTGYYQDDREHRCDPCHPFCLSCTGKHSHECVRCKAHLLRQGQDCVESCPASHYSDAASQACHRCDAACGECQGGGDRECLSCAPGLLYLRSQRRCLHTCPPDHHRDPTHHLCEPCHGSCKTCIGKEARSCESCHDGYSFRNGACQSMCAFGQYPTLQDSGNGCEDCHGSCLECRGPGEGNCTECPVLAILAAGGRCLPCCRLQEPEEEGEDGASHRSAVSPGGPSQHQQQDCCNCTETQGECILGTNFAFRNEEEEDDSGGNLALFVTSGLLLLLGLGGIVIFIRHSRSKTTSQPDIIIPRGYEKLGGGGGGFSNSGGGGSSSRQSQLVDLSGRGKGAADDDDEDEDDEDEDEDIVYMGQDGTVYRKFRYGRPGEDNEDELEYDDESYAFR